MSLLIKRVKEQRLPGSYLEAGVWRGGMSIMATASLQLYGLGAMPVYLCDSFQGLPLPRKGSLRHDEKGYSKFNSTMAVGMETVLRNFDLFGVPRHAVTAVPGYFVDALPPLRASLLAKQENLAVLRMDGDMYDSTIDILYNLYDLVVVGGYVVVDDFGWGSGASLRMSNQTARSTFGAKMAVLDFRQKHGIEDGEHPMRDIDGLTVVKISVLLSKQGLPLSRT